MQVSKRARDGGVKKGWLGWVFLVVIWLLIVSMSRDYFQTKKGFLRIKETESRLVEVKSKNAELENRLKEVSLPEYKERLLREKLNLQRSDELVVILPGLGAKVIRQENTQEIHTNWRKWMSLLGF